VQTKILSKIFLIFIFYGFSFTINAQSKQDSTLPVELIYFYSEMYEDSVLLKWGTATEVSNYGFDIERSINNFNFQTIGFVEGSGNSNSPKHYTFADSLVEMTGIVYYRLKQIDFIGSFEYSDTVTVNFSSSITLESSNVPSQFNVSNNYPNPFNPVTKMNVELPSRQILKINLYDIGGKLVKEIISQEFLPGTYQLYIDFSAYSSGIYFVRFESQKNAVTKRIAFVK
jgi:hypothetical protein